MRWKLHNSTTTRWRFIWLLTCRKVRLTLFWGAAELNSDTDKLSVCSLRFDMSRTKWYQCAKTVGSWKVVSFITAAISGIVHRCLWRDESEAVSSGSRYFLLPWRSLCCFVGCWCLIGDILYVGSVPFLAVRDEFHPKRNQARQKLATLPKNRFKDLASDVFAELERRYINPNNPTSSSNNNSSNNLTSNNVRIVVFHFQCQVHAI